MRILILSGLLLAALFPLSPARGGEVDRSGSIEWQARAFLQRYHDVADPGAESLWLGFQVESALGDAEVAGRFRQRLVAAYPASDEVRQLNQLEGQRGGQ